MANQIATPFVGDEAVSLDNFNARIEEINTKAAPLEHGHTASEITGLDAQLAEKAAVSHNHSAADVTSGTLPVARGGTGASTASAALTALGGVKKSGDKMTGNLVIDPSDGTYPRVNLVSTANSDGKTAEARMIKNTNATYDSGLNIMDYSYGGTETVNSCSLVLNNARTALADKLVFYHSVDGTSTKYLLYGTHNKPSLSKDVTGTLPVANGGTGATSLLDVSVGNAAKVRDITFYRYINQISKELTETSSFEEMLGEMVDNSILFCATVGWAAFDGRWGVAMVYRCGSTRVGGILWETNKEVYYLNGTLTDSGGWKNMTMGGRKISVQSSEPANPKAGDLWIW